MGSSPRMRGALGIALGEARHSGIIPAYAGSTGIRKLHSIWLRDHPRVCGEHSIPLCRHYIQLGSSPRMRGALSGAVSGVQGHGIIPAYAGSTPMVILLSLVGVPKGYGARHRKRKTPPKRGFVSFPLYTISPSCVSRTDFATAFITSKLALPTFSASLAFTLLQTVSDSTESRKSFPSQVSDFMKHDAGAGWSSGFT